MNIIHGCTDSADETPAGFTEVHSVHGSSPTTAENDATLQATGGTPIEINTSGGAPAVTVDASGTDIRLRIAGLAGQTWKWVGKISGVIHMR